MTTKAKSGTQINPQEVSYSVSGETRQIIDEVLKGRAASYRLFSRILLSPLTESEINELAAEDFAAKATEFDNEDLLAEGFNDIGRALSKRNSATRQQLATDYTMCFDGVETVEGETAVPYASIFLGEQALLNQEPRHAVYKIYRAEEIVPRSTAKQPEDHISYELDFLALMSIKASEALESGDTSEVLRALEVSQDFIAGHILTWLDLLTNRANSILKTRFYRGALKATKGYLHLDQQIIAELKEMLVGEQTS